MANDSDDLSKFVWESLKVGAKLGGHMWVAKKNKELAAEEERQRINSIDSAQRLESEWRSNRGYSCNIQATFGCAEINLTVYNPAGREVANADGVVADRAGSLEAQLTVNIPSRGPTPQTCRGLLRIGQDASHITFVLFDGDNKESFRDVFVRKITPLVAPSL